MNIEAAVDQAFSLGKQEGFGTGFRDGQVGTIKFVEELLRILDNGGFISTDALLEGMSALTKGGTANT